MFNEFTVTYSLAFAEEIVHQDSNRIWVALMLTYVLLVYLLKRSLIYVLICFIIMKILEGIYKSEFKNLLLLATQDSYFTFNILYKQKDGMAKGSPLGPTLANVSLSFYEVKLIEQCPKEFKIVFYRRYVN